MTAADDPVGHAGSTPQDDSVRTHDIDLVRRQLGRDPRGLVAIGHRCPCGAPDVVTTSPRLPDRTPFPTTFYVTCPRLTGAISTLETTGIMREMSDRLDTDSRLAEAYRRAHTDYLTRRAGLGEVPELTDISAGGMPVRVKCLHALVGHALVAGPGVNPFGDEALRLLGPWWAREPCAHGEER